MNKKIIATASTAAIVLLGIAACGSSKQDSQSQQQATTEQYAQKLTAAEPYPLGQMNDSAERANLRERLLRMNDPNKIGYVTELTMNGQVVAQYTIKGKVSSTGSQLTNSQNINYSMGSGGGGNTVTDSMGEDGRYGPEECATAGGIFFFDTRGGFHEWCGQWSYSDIPENLTSKPLITIDESAKPTSTAGQLK